MRAFVEGKQVAQYVVVDGASIEGRIGFATSMGVMRIEDARLVRLDRSRLAPAAGREARAFDLDAATSLPPWDAVNAPSRGLPLHDQGTLLVFVPAPDAPLATDLEQASFVQRATRALRDVSVLLRREQPTQPVVVALPSAVDASVRASIEKEARATLGERIVVRAHGLAAPSAAADAEDAPKAEPGAAPAPKSPSRARSVWLAFVDQAGTVRASARIVGAKTADDVFLRWLRVFREHGRPERELPAFERPKEAGR
ncbi:MAG: hypothetical protein IPJ77_09525 [Planctomycetes bacterium]|nr:hypothetical protein [Planctomycetota bacterium]